MRLRLSIRTTAVEMPWSVVLAPGRQVIYELLHAADPALGVVLHEKGWGPHRLAPFGHGAPVFPGAGRRRGAYAVGGRGVLEFGSPLPQVVEALAAALRERPVLDWGGTALRVDAVEVVDPPGFASGAGQMSTATPVVMKGSGRDPDGARTTRQAWILPHDVEFAGYLAGNLRRKAETLGLAPQVALEQILWVGAKRSFVVKDGKKVGAPVTVALRGTPEMLRAVWSWGLGQANSAGFGWVAA